MQTVHAHAYLLLLAHVYILQSTQSIASHTRHVHAPCMHHTMRISYTDVTHMLQHAHTDMLQPTHTDMLQLALKHMLQHTHIHTLQLAQHTQHAG
jgi:hypothetical protein